MGHGMGVFQETSLMKRVFSLVLLLSLVRGVAAQAQTIGTDPFLQTSTAFAGSEPMGGAVGGGGQTEPAAYSGGLFSRLTFGGTVSSLGVGMQAGTSLGPHFDVRGFGNYLNLNHSWIDNGFDLKLNIEYPNAGVKLDIYPLHRFPLRITPGYLFFNQNRIRVDYRAQPGTTFTLNHIDWRSDDADPVHGTGFVPLSGTGFMIMAGPGRIVARSGRHLTFPMEGGVVFLHTPVITFNMLGQICASNQTRCQPASTFPTFAANLVKQVASWNRKAAVYQTYPIFEAGVAYTFSWRRRQVK
jgi:hypothetical protein